MHHNNRWPTEPPQTGYTRSTAKRRRLRPNWPAITSAAAVLGIAAVAVLYVWYTEGRAVRTASRAAVMSTAKPTAVPGPPVMQRSDMVPGDGTWLVGTNADRIKPGVYRSEAGQPCYWERLSGLSGESVDLIANGYRTGQQLVEIKATDYAFGAQGCGKWVPVR